MVERLRIYITWVFALSLVVFVCVSESLWEDKAPFISTILFCFGALLVGIASLGRLWCSIYIAGYKTDYLVAQGPYSMSGNPLISSR